jgi:ribulose-bisphosphate carboxylase large chain
MRHDRENRRGKSELLVSREFVQATYRIGCSVRSAADVAQQIALEQTVEVPADLIRDPEILANVVGQVRSVRPVEGDPHQAIAVIDYAADLAGTHVGQMWNLLYGNISLKRQIRLERVDLPPSVLRQFRGPQLGIPGVRQRLGVFGRPLLATALKPRGSSPQQLADMAAAFARGGGDLVKDDHNLVDNSFEQFQQRTRLIRQAVDHVTQLRGQPCWYLPNLSVPPRWLDRAIDYLVQEQFAGALIAPFLLGLDVTRDVTASAPLFWWGHPTFTGSLFHDPQHGVAPGVLLGQWFRLLGCDGTIFPNSGGRFAFSAEECTEIARAATSADVSVAPCWPSPAGGMSFDKLLEMSGRFGPNAIFLIGGALLGRSANLEESTRAFRESIDGLFPGHQDSTAVDPIHLRDLSNGHLPLGSQFAAPLAESALFTSACELPAVGTTSQQLLEHLAFQAGFRWQGRRPLEYKADQQLPFRDVSRIELIGQQGEQTGFDVRYFEIGPDGYSSFEQHAHTHVVIGVRGEGVLMSGDRQLVVKPNDVAYVPPLRPHQLKNTHSEPFGFFCIVDHVRDRPRPALPQ